MVFGYQRLTGTIKPSNNQAVNFKFIERGENILPS